MSTRTLEGNTALVTGGGVGIGLGVAQALAEDGARIALTYRTHEPDAETLKSLQASSGHDVIAIRADLTDPSEVDAMAADLRERLGALDILVNNVGGLIQRSSVQDMSFELWRRVLATNLDSTFLVTHALLPIIRRDRGRIVNVASLAGRNGGHPGATAYASSKAAIFGFTRGLSKELAPAGITVNALAPGFIEDTPFHSTFTTEESKRQTISTIPAGRAGVPADVAAAVVWLAAENTGFITGTVLDINGGQYFG